MKYFFEVKNYIIKYINIILFSVLFISIVGSFGFTYYVYGKEIEIKKELHKNLTFKEEASQTEKKLVEEPHYVYVDIKGYVKNPGVHKVNENSRVNDVISVAGGLIKNANTKYINLSKKITDEMIIIVYSNQEVKTMEASQNKINTLIEEGKDTYLEKGEVSSKPVNINTASATELMTLSGIGESKANAIIEYRSVSGSFLTIEDIMKVSGISELTYAKIKAFITV